MRKCTAFSLLFLFANVLFSVFLYGQDIDPIRPSPFGTGAAAITAAEEFKFGVQAFNRFSYNEAILSFERALSFRPGEAMILEWLGNAYYRSGFEETALRQWRAALDIFGINSGAGMRLSHRIETVQNRRFLFPVANDGVRYVEAGRYPGRIGEVVLYRQPSSILKNSDGSIWVVAYGSNEIVRIDVNGIIRDRRRGPLNGFDRPYDIVRGIDGRLYVSEFRGGRVSVLDSRGNWQAYIGSRGFGDGQFVGPQNLAVDEDGYLYVADYGNRRISKFDPDGAFIISFGLKSGAFPGFLSPTGIAAANGKIYAADNAANAIYMFDPNGNYLGRLAIGALNRPESLRFLSNGMLIAVDANRILLIEPEAAIVRELGLAGNDRIRITCADMDANGNITAANFSGGEIVVMTRLDDLASGFFVLIRNVYADRFPVVTVDFTVEDRLRRPIVGLDPNNFFLTEGGVPVADQVYLVPGNRRAGADISILVERSEKTASLRDDLAAAARDIGRAVQEMESSNVVSVVSAGAQPRREQHAASLENAVRGTADLFTARWRFDLGLRLAATDLLSASSKRSVIYVGSGNLGDLAFEQYSLSELASYLANNGIVFNAVITGGGQVTAGLEYLCNETGGTAMHQYRPRGIGELVKSVAETPSGLYSFSFTSRLSTDFGRAWLPFEAEVHLLERSGRDNTGYFSPVD